MSVRHVIHDNDRCRLVVEVDVGLVTLSLFFGSAPVGVTTWTTGTGFSSHASVHLCPADARDRVTLNHALSGLEWIAGRGTPDGPDARAEAYRPRRVTLDALHRSVLDVTRRPTA